MLSFGRRVKPRLDIGEDVVSPYLWSRSIRKIDVVALTHAHDDHARRSARHHREFPSRRTLDRRHAAPARRGAPCVRKRRRKRPRIVPMSAGRSFQFGGARIDVLSPSARLHSQDAPANNDSLALRITYRERSFLLTGDMEKPMEQRALGVRPAAARRHSQGGPPRQQHLQHRAVSGCGAAGLRDYLRRVREFVSPSHPLVLERLAEHRARVLRTDTDGLINRPQRRPPHLAGNVSPRNASHVMSPFAIPAFRFSDAAAGGWNRHFRATAKLLVL